MKAKASGDGPCGVHHTGSVIDKTLLPTTSSYWLRTFFSFLIFFLGQTCS
jgi:hypothetical protein